MPKEVEGMNHHPSCLSGFSQKHLGDWAPPQSHLWKGLSVQVVKAGSLRGSWKTGSRHRSEFAIVSSEPMCCLLTLTVLSFSCLFSFVLP